MVILLSPKPSYIVPRRKLFLHWKQNFPRRRWPVASVQWKEKVIVEDLQEEEESPRSLQSLRQGALQA